MKVYIYILSAFLSLTLVAQETKLKPDIALGLNYSSQKSTFTIWAPKADSARIQLTDVYQSNPQLVYLTYNMKKDENGTWVYQSNKDLANWHYTFSTKNKGVWSNWIPDPYAKAVTANGKKGVVLNLRDTDPSMWEKDKRPALKNFTDIVLYELHVRDFSMHENSDIQNKGKFIGLTEQTENPEKGIEYLRKMGVTHLHLLPSFDYASVDETRPDSAQFNWGYDPQNYNVPEGSYSTNAFDPSTRIRELKQTVMGLHASGIRVVMDVVYNHTFDAATSGFEQLVPDYFYRKNADGSYSNASGCGNETASEKDMMRKFIIESVCYWATEYHIDGFRFDLMGIHDIETMKQVRDSLNKIDPTIFVYGEGWTAGGSPLDENLRLVKKNMKKVNGIAAFCDDMRDGIKGPWNDHHKTAFVGAVNGLEESIKFGIVAATYHPQIDYGKVNYSKEAWANEPSQCINYVSCHDDHTLWDKIFVSNESASEEERIKMDLLAQTIVFTSQGVPFLHAGEEFLRTKNLVSNSYKTPDSINALDWNRRFKYDSIVRFYCSLIKLRKEHPAFRMPTSDLIKKHLEFLETKKDNLIAYRLKDNANGDSWREIIVLFNGLKTEQEFDLQTDGWKVCMSGNAFASDKKPITGTKVKVSAIGAVVLYKE